MKTILADFKICISVSLIFWSKTKIFTDYKDKISTKNAEFYVNFMRFSSIKRFKNFWFLLSGLIKSILLWYLDADMPIIFSYSRNTSQWIHASSKAWTLSRRRFLSYRNQSIDLFCKSMDWFLYNRDFCHERFKTLFIHIHRESILICRKA